MTSDTSPTWIYVREPRRLERLVERIPVLRRFGPRGVFRNGRRNAGPSADPFEEALVASMVKPVGSRRDAA